MSVALVVMGIAHLLMVLVVPPSSPTTKIVVAMMVGSSSSGIGDHGALIQDGSPFVFYAALTSPISALTL
jgi:hypothetical protein